MSEYISGTLVPIEILDKRSRYNKKGSSREYKIEQLKKRKDKINSCLDNIIRIESNNSLNRQYYFVKKRFVGPETIRNRFRDEETYNILYFYKFKPSYKLGDSSDFILPKFQRQLDSMEYDYTLWKESDFSYNLQNKFSRVYEFYDLNSVDMDLNPEEEWEEKILNYIYPNYYKQKRENKND